MATSIRAGVAALPEDAAAVVICLGDMPALASDDIARLVAAFESGGADICVPVAGERRGNPALFARRFFPELQALSGDSGARGLIAAHPEQVREVRLEGTGTLTDLDTEADIDAYNRTQNQ
jgi:molybdenum cofactor cytidylyltransferase